MRRLLILGSLFCLLVTTHAWAQFNIENPTANTTQSGISVVSGWICNATKVEVVIDDFGGVPIPHGIARPDAQSACGGKMNTGFGGLINWNQLGDGPHAVKVIADGQQIANIPVTVVTFGTNFLRGESRTISSWFAGCRVALAWRESQQNFAVAQTDACFRPLLGKWEFVTRKSTGEERNHYSLDRIVTEPVENDGVTEIQLVEGNDLDHGGAVGLLRVSDLEVATSIPYTFYLASVFSSRCEVFFFNQSSANTVTGVGLSFPADPFEGCERLPVPTPTLSSMTGTKTGAALSQQQVLEDRPQMGNNEPTGDSTISSQMLSALLKKTLQFVLNNEP